MLKLLSCCALLLSAIALPSTSRAAECVEIASGGSTLAPGSYCLSANLTVNQASGALITIAADNVLLDCRGYTLTNTQTNPNAGGYAIYLAQRKGVRVRNCHVTGGWSAGIYAYQDNGLANGNRDIEISGNDVSGAFWFGILAYGTGLHVHDNRVQDIGGRGSFAMGIRVGASILAGERRMHVVTGNFVTAVASPASNAYGIYSNNSDGGSFADNTISDIVPHTSYYRYGIRIATGGDNRVAGNHIVTGDPQGLSIGINGAVDDACYDNHLRAHYPTFECDATMGNY